VSSLKLTDLCVLVLFLAVVLFYIGEVVAERLAGRVQFLLLLSMCVM